MSNRILLANAMVLLNIAFCASGLGQERWRTDLPPLLTARQEVGVAELDGMVYVIGGILEDRTTTGIVERFNTHTGEWESVPPLPNGSLLNHAGAVGVNGKVYVVGGLTENFLGSNSLFAFDPEDNSWERLADVPSPRGAMGVAAIDNQIFAAGGQTGNSSQSLVTYVIDEDRWETLPDMPTGRNHLAAVTLNGTFYAVGGRRSGELRNQLEAFDPSENAWITLAPMPTARGGIAAAVVDELIYVFGGEGNRADPLGTFPQVEVYDPALNEWTGLEDMALPRHGIGAAAIGNHIYIPGGSPVEGFGVTDFHDALVIDPPHDIGDFNRDGILDATDIDLLTTEVLRNTHDPLFDLNNDMQVNGTDRVIWVTQRKATWIGDVNFDLEFNSADVIAVFQQGEFQDGVEGNSGWTDGDWNGDKEFDSSDVVFAFQDGGYEMGRRQLVNAVPEPTSALVLMAGLILSVSRNRPRGRVTGCSVAEIGRR